MYLVIDDNRRLVYETISDYGHGLAPTPYLVAAHFMKCINGVIELQQRTGHYDRAQFLFREDSFDPVTKVRRGRFYRNVYGSAPQFVQPHPLAPQMASKTNEKGWIRLQHGTTRFEPLNIMSDQHIHAKPGDTIALGATSAISLYELVDAEASAFDGQTLATLKAISHYGAVPRLRSGTLPEESQKQVADALDALSDLEYRLDPESIVDKCRNVLLLVLGHYLDQPEKELGKLISALSCGDDKKSQPRAVIAATEIVNRLHPRVKPNERKRLRLRSIEQADAQLALHCVSLVLRDIGWSAA